MIACARACVARDLVDFLGRNAGSGGADKRGGRLRRLRRLGRFVVVVVAAGSGGRCRRGGDGGDSDALGTGVERVIDEAIRAAAASEARVTKGRAVLVVLLFGHPAIERRQRAENRAADPRRVLAL